MSPITATPPHTFTKPADWDTLFPAMRPMPANGVYELGLVLGGTVSSGAYTAGVVDFLIEALDTWQAAKAVQPANTHVPSWDTRIQVVTGTSGGGVIAALMGRALSWHFPHVRTNSSEAECKLNPLYEVWVNQLDIMGMLDTADLQHDHANLVSLLNPKPLELARDLIVNYEAHFDVSQRLQRHYLANPLPLFLTLTNLRGVPYSLNMGGGLSQHYVAHADHVRIAAYTLGEPGTLRPDEFGACVKAGDHSGYLTWSEYAMFALGTSAFPVGFPTRELQRPALHYQYRPVVIPGSDGRTDEVRPMVPEWALMTPLAPSNTYDFLAADGGMTNNEPIQLARSELAGHVARNPRNGRNAKRGVLLIDPFADVPVLGLASAQNLFNELGAMLGSWKEQARYDSRDIMLANDEDCFSRFMITAHRPMASTGGKSIATACASAFGGFLSKAFRHHDFLLGRSNAQAYLRNKLVLPIDNPLFSAWRQQADADQLGQWTVMDDGKPSLPIIPLLGACANSEPVPPYPRDAFDVHDPDFQRALLARIRAVLKQASHDIEPKGFQGLLLSPLLKFLQVIGDDKLQDLVTDWFDQSLAQWELRS
jgi:predicted acylesterase/phospholipase RssA